MSDLIIEIQEVEKVYKMGKQQVVALGGISLNIKKGEYLAVTGPSGSGKSTLLHILGCLDLPTGGRYRFKGKEVGSLCDKELARIRNRDIGFVFQFFNLLPRENSFHNVKLPLTYRTLSDNEKKELVISALKKVNMTHRISHLPTELSGGEQQRIAIARAIVTNPELILADEPTGNLDSKTGEEIIKLFEKLHQDGKTVIIVSHEPSIARRAQRVIKLKDGKIEQ
jgi:putative ABC transport system ATP-binding protein